jgi:hypothetical protein
MIHTSRIAKLCEDLEFDELTAWRHLRDQERARKLYGYQLPGRYRDALEGE